MMNNTMEYKGYHTLVEYSPEDRCFVGEVIGLNDLIAFSGTSVDAFERAFHESIDGYLDMCKRKGRIPDKEYSGRFNFRPGPELHQRIDQYAKRTGESINSVASTACEYYLDRPESAAS